MSSRRILAIDAGTTGIRTILFDQSSRVLSKSYQEFSQITPAPGLLEHDPIEIWTTTLGLIKQTLARAGCAPAEVAAVGVTTQRGTSILWDRATGRPLHNAIVWQDMRTAARCVELSELAGFPVSPFTSLSKFEWLLSQTPAARRKVDSGQACIGTLDSWLLWKLTSGRAFATDPSSAIVTQMWDPATGEWSPALAALLGIDVARLAKVRPTSDLHGETDAAVFGAAVPVAALAGDQQAAMFGQLCVEPGMGKATYGTSVMVGVNTGTSLLAAARGLFAFALWRLGTQDWYCLEGVVVTGGASVGWLRDLGLLASVEQSAALAMSVADSGGVFFLPALQGLGTPFLEPDVKGALLGLTRATTRAHIARAVQEGVAFRTRQVVEAMRAASPVPAFATLRVDGGMAENDAFLSMQTDVLGCPVERLATPQATALGVAYLAGMATGCFRDIAEIEQRRAPGKRFEPGDGAAALQAKYEDWQEVLSGARVLAAKLRR